MDYLKHYNRLIERAKNRKTQGYVEVHHIFPQCFGGSDDNDNLAALYEREHYVAHKLLIFIYRLDKRKHAQMVHAATAMSMKQGQRKGSRIYAWLRQQWIAVLSEEKRGNKLRLGVPWSDEERKGHAERVERLRKASPTGKMINWSDEQIAAISARMLGNKNGIHSVHAWITNGIENTRIKPNDPLPAGWRWGKTASPKEVGKIFITNGIEDKRINSLGEIPENWHLGRTGGYKFATGNQFAKLGSGHTGHTHSDEAKQKMSDAKLGKSNPKISDAVTAQWEKKRADGQSGHKLNDQQVIEIFLDPDNAEVTADKYNISKQTVAFIRQKRFYKHLTENLTRPSTKSSQHKGVCFDKNRKKWKAAIQIEGKSILIGRFDTELEAAEARQNYIKEND